MPAYAGLIGSMGLTFLLKTAWLLPLMLVFLGVALAAMAVRARRRHGYGPLLVGLGAAALIVIGKFVIVSNLALYSGTALLMGASIWNAWPKSARARLALPRLRSILTGSQERGVPMAQRRKIEVFTAGCPACNEAVALVQQAACGSCDVAVLDMNDAAVAERAKALGVQSVPAVAIDGRLVECCRGAGVDVEALRRAGLGQAVA